MIAFDQRGHGLSTIGRGGVGSWQMAERLRRRARRRTTSRDGVLAAHSMGGFVAIRFLLENRDLVERHLAGALLMSTMAGDVARDNPQNKLQIPLLKSGILARLVRTDRVGRPFARTLMGDEPDDEMGAAFLRMFRAQDLGPLVPILEAMVAREPLRRPRRDRPALHDRRRDLGPHDAAVPHRGAGRGHPGVAARPRAARRHMVNWEAPDLVVEQILALAPTA